MQAQEERRSSTPRRGESIHELLLVETMIWLVAFKWSFIFAYFESPTLVAVLNAHCVVGLLPMALLVGARYGRADGATAQDIMCSASLFSITTCCTATSLHISMGGWSAGGYLPLWCICAVMIQCVYNVPSSVLKSTVGTFASVLLLNMAEEFGVAATMPAPVYDVIRASNSRLRALVPQDGAPRPLYGWMCLNNFFTSMALLMWMLRKVTRQRKEWQKKSDDLIYNLVPAAVADKIRAGVPVDQLTHRHVDATCFFSDIVNYTQICNEVCDATRVIRVLSQMYQAFDIMVDLSGAFKVETIGDSYFAVATLDWDDTMRRSSEESCYRVAVFARAVLMFARGPFGKLHGLQIRVGLHTGDLVTGVLGDIRPRLCLVGDTVNMASRMETHAEPGTINLGSSSAKLLEPFFHLIPRGPVHVRGKGTVLMYTLGEPKFEQCPFGLPHDSSGMAQIAWAEVSRRSSFSKSGNIRTLLKEPRKSGDGQGEGSGEAARSESLERPGSLPRRGSSEPCRPSSVHAHCPDRK